MAVVCPLPHRHIESDAETGDPALGRERVDDDGVDELDVVGTAIGIKADDERKDRLACGEVMSHDFEHTADFARALHPDAVDVAFAHDAVGGEHIALGFREVVGATQARSSPYPPTQDEDAVEECRSLLRHIKAGIPRINHYLRGSLGHP